jgi:adenosine deaminase
VFAGLVVGVREAESDLDITCRLILDVDKPRLGTHAMEMVELAGTLDRDMLIGVGGDSTERGVDHRVFVPAWQRAAELGLRRTFHAGEDGPVENIRIAVDEMGCERIDHGTVLLDDPDLTRRVADRGIPVTSCPGSNVALHVVEDLQAHPFARQRAQGVLLSINGDDPTMFGITPASEYADVAEAFGFDLGTMEDIALDTITSTFLDDADRAALRTRFLADFDVLRAEYGHPARA